MQLYTLDGKVLTVSVSNNMLDLSHLPNGLYVLKTDGQALRIVKQ
jgi:hypothetical protein